MFAALMTGLSLGFSAGISPGPLNTLVLTTSLERGLRAGLRVAVAPLLTDLPIVVISLLIFTALPFGLEIALTLGGALLLTYMGVDTLLRARDARLSALIEHGAAGQDLLRGFMVNLLSPHPWLFWLGVGSPILIAAWRKSPLQGVLFLVGFYTLLVGSKIAIAMFVAGARTRLTDRWYRGLLAFSGLLLLLFAGLLFWQAGARLVG